MIFITGYKLTFNPTPTHRSGNSVQQLMAVKEANMAGPQRATRKSNMFDGNFISGHQYRVARIQKIFEDKIENVLYVFADLTNTSNDDIEVKIANTSKGDEYIAAMSGQVEKLKADRQKAYQAYTEYTD